MFLKEAYIVDCSSPIWYDRFVSIGKKQNGAMFKFFNTNFRSLLSLQNAYEVFYNETNGKLRSEWAVSEGAEQEKAKQYVTRLRETNLFRISKDYYIPTKKGQVFKTIFSTNCYNKEERWLLTFLICLNSYFDSIPNYFMEIAKRKTNKIIDAGFNICEIIESAKKFLINNNTAVYRPVDMFREQYLYMDSFCDDVEFIRLFHEASEKEKEDLYEYVTQKYINHDYSTKNNQCVLSYKFKPSGNMNKETLVNHAKIMFLVTKYIARYGERKDIELQDFYEFFVSTYREIYLNSNENKLMEFIESNKNIFKVIYSNVVGINEVDDVSDSNEELTTDKSLPSIGDIDITDDQQLSDIRKVNTILQRVAKEKTGYRCAAESIYNCQKQYFTSKAVGETYLEIHHLVPYEFRNDFENGVEVLPNYVPLCPHCHMLLHKAVDRERRNVLHMIFNLRREELKQNGIDIDEEQLDKYYGIEE